MDTHIIYVVFMLKQNKRMLCWCYSIRQEKMICPPKIQMIDNTECLFFLNTPNSISFDAPVHSTTSSLWIYSEIAMSRLIRKQVPERLKNLNESRNTFSKKLIRYRLPMDHLPIVNEEDMSKWEKVDRRLISYFEKSGFLDELYKLVDKKDEQKIRSLK